MSMNKYWNEKEKGYECPKCGDTSFSTIKKLANHHLKAHKKFLPQI